MSSGLVPTAELGPLDFMTYGTLLTIIAVNTAIIASCCVYYMLIGWTNARKKEKRD